MNYFNQVGFSLECLWTDWDIRANANLPFGGKTQQANDFDVTNTPVFVGNFLARQAFVKTDFAVDVIDVKRTPGSTLAATIFRERSKVVPVTRLACVAT